MRKKEIPLRIKLLLFLFFVYAALLTLQLFSPYFVLGGILFLEQIAFWIHVVLLFFVLLCIYGTAWRARGSFLLVVFLFSVVLAHELVSLGAFVFLHEEIATFVSQFMTSFSLSGVKTIFLIKKILAIFLSVYVLITAIEFKQYFFK